MFSVLFTILYIIRAYAVHEDNAILLRTRDCYRNDLVGFTRTRYPGYIHPRRGKYNSILLLLYVHDDLCILRSSILGQ
jgi:hypothetical protein